MKPHSFGLPLRMNVMQRTQSRMDLFQCAFGPFSWENWPNCSVGARALWPAIGLASSYYKRSSRACSGVPWVRKNCHQQTRGNEQSRDHPYVRPPNACKPMSNVTLSTTTLTWLTEKELKHNIKKSRDTKFVERKTWKFYSGGEKTRNASAVATKIKKKANRHFKNTTFPL